MEVWFKVPTAPFMAPTAAAGPTTWERSAVGSSSSFIGGTYGGGLQGEGILYEITTDGVFTVLHSFSGGDDGVAPTSVIQGSDGYYYGTSLNGGDPTKGGSVFRFAYCLGLAAISNAISTEAAPTCSVPITARLFYNGEDITDTKTPKRVIVGQQIPLTVKFYQNGKELTAPNPVITTLKWMIPGSSIAGYSPSIEAATVTPLVTTDITKRNIAYYWVDGSSQQNWAVSINVTANNQPVSARTTLTLLRPTAKITAITGAVTVGGGWDNTYTLAFGSNNSSPGIVFNRTRLSNPTGFSGKWEWVQLANINRRRFRTDTNTWERFVGVGVLDCTVSEGTNAADCSTYNYAATVIRTSDSPRTPLSKSFNIPLTPPINRAEVDESFSMYLMYQPTGAAGANAIWVPLRKVTWSWHGKAQLDSTVQKWKLVPGSSDNSVDPKDGDATIHPTWTSRFPQLEWKP
ncbi:choice-of-anchor tandem repeat GloVer-containing protein [Gloeobacter violaceus]|uniref:Glr2917 protein n=1 Tax=Gloeobacter violaceus (strain ATCC 29082 / PCC 7421) TaxID=251221 RepID=Q7NCR1_GLOVI|nr:choice-of-anchor tandem repeat GloVer-containing protein [Gloeobacter violaceus]BAC90858.1 glr2917 [Gloeobacter violaceus PCC 7421]